MMGAHVQTLKPCNCRKGGYLYNRVFFSLSAVIPGNFSSFVRKKSRLSPMIGKVWDIPWDIPMGGYGGLRRKSWTALVTALALSSEEELMVRDPGFSLGASYRV